MSDQNEVEYKTGLVYMIECKDPAIKQFYIGSTMRTYSERRNEHKYMSKNKKSKLYNFINDNGKWNNWNLTVIEYIDVKKDYEIRIFEQLWIETLYPELNENRAYISEFELKLQKNIFANKHYHNNKTKILNHQKQVIRCSNCDKNYTKVHKQRHQRSAYCQNYKSTASESVSESFIESDTDVE